MPADPRVEALLAEGAAVPLEGWDFSWFDGRATEERPRWGYAVTAAERVGVAEAVLDVQTGGGEVFAWILAHAGDRPSRLAACEPWPPNQAVARRTLSPFGVAVEEEGEGGALPFEDAAFDLVVSRHPVATAWPEIARVLRPGGTYLSQQVGPGSNRELTDFLMGPQPVGNRRDPVRARSEAEAAGLEVVALDAQALRVAFFDLAAVVHFLRKVPWTVPGFAVDAYRDRLEALHAEIEREGAFVAHSRRFLIEARRPA